VIPRDNEPDLEELPEETREELEFFPVDSIAEVFEVAFGKGKKTLPRAAASAERQAAAPSSV
jgi:ATP-dependent Lon protease